jgi:CheY-like chemotaxis protein
MKILIADDSKVCLQLMEAYLKKIPSVLKIVKASDGLEALNLIESQSIKFDMMFLDIWMPKIDGYTLAEKFRKKAIIVATTGDDLSVIKSQKKTHLFKAILRKPIKFEEIKKIIEENSPQKALN